MMEELKNNKPTAAWQQRMEDDEIFTVENIKATDEILDTYINRLEGSVDKMSEQDILEYVQEIVIGLNELNEQFDYFIETLEREELCEFIIKAANAAGLETEEDITEEWREW
ncbi:hypothetical protein H8R29_09160 [Priestia megaterium]|jgi:hypothetical protein|uniref:Uncharacterized protein n=3 Tax=Priestia megaterium TaxID=1404 RepID=A0A1I2Z667_PRIMG|nr:MULTISPECIES: hypothetical protein [Priestia]ADF38591.1 conserved hypothetical protein [Priestia megaterium DSM 319]AJI22864.1 hypothetical protein BG04_4111 [Priestia megaterium NBRC 15308 = ATCC 14581]AYE51845.1 hypothetical protein OEA_19560 [Priestia megaterium NCT-2]KFM97357.1 hypothetical protein DJ91_1160 [Priestia megaterium]KGJ79897.1 hypothetical protein BMT_20325 [Priestia megaterium NBRC 15308 = ATCC 14581]